MKKIAVLFIIAISVVSGCAREQHNPELPEWWSGTYTFTADFTLEGLAGSFCFTRYGPEEYMLEFLAPDSLAGMVITVQSGRVTLDYRGITHEDTLVNLARTHPAAALVDLLSGIKKPVIATAAKISGLTIYELEDGSKITASDTALVSIDAPVYGLTLTVTEFRLLTE